MSWRRQPVEPRRSYRPSHSPGQRLTLVASIVTIAICLAGGIGLFVAKHLREQVQLVTIESTTAQRRPATPAITRTTEQAAAGPTVDPAATNTTEPTGITQVDTSQNTTPAGTTPTGTTPTGTIQPAGEPGSTAASAPGTSGSATQQPTEPTFPKVDPYARNFLVAAADNHACVDPGSPWASAADPDRPASDRSDSIMMIRVDPTTNRVAVLSFPRDLWVRIPGRGSQRINAAYRVNEPDRLIQTIFVNFGIQTDHYIQVDFCAFKRIVDAVGGIDMSFSTGIRDDHTDLLIKEPGCHHFVGDEALAYVRSRHLRPRLKNGKWGKEDPGSDLARITRQQDFLSRILAKALDKGLLNPSVARGMLDTLTKGDIVMSKLSIDDLMGFAGVMRSVDPNQIRRYTVEGKGVIIGGNWVIDYKSSLGKRSMQQIIQLFRGEARLEATPAPPVTAGTGVATPSVTSATAPPDDPKDNAVQAILPEPGVSC